MDNPTPGGDPDRRVRMSFGPDIRYTLAAAAGIVVFALLALVGTDSPGRLLFVLAAVLLAGYVASDLLYRPRLVLATDGVQVNTPTARLACAWTDVERFEVDARRRFGLSAYTVEIDTGDQLVVLSRRALGADPIEIAELAARFRTSPTGQ